MNDLEIKNRKASFNYQIFETFEAGIVLKGTEIKSIRKSHVSIEDSYGIIKNNEAFILNMYIKKYEEGNRYNHEERRTRKLLLHKKEIKKIKERIERDGLTLIPLKLYLVRGRVKILLGLAKGKKLYDKRESIKERDIKRRELKVLKNY